MYLLLAADSADVSACMLGTTYFVNACVQCRGLARVAVFRLCGPATRALPPCCDVPYELRKALRIQHQLLDGMQLALLTAALCQVYAVVRYCRTLLKNPALYEGGFEFDGGTEISPFNKEQIQGATDKALKAGYTSVVVSGVFCPVNNSQEEAAAEIIQKHATMTYIGELSR